MTQEKAVLRSLLGRKVEECKAPVPLPSVPSPCLVFIGLVPTCCYVRDLLNICFLLKEHYSKTGLCRSPSLPPVPQGLRAGSAEEQVLNKSSLPLPSFPFLISLRQGLI